MFAAWFIPGRSFARSKRVLRARKKTIAAAQVDGRGGRSPHRLRRSSKFHLAYSSMPAIEADIKLAIVPASMARTPSLANSPRLLGASAPMPPI